MRKKRALVTGGAGFLGSHLCDALLLKDYEVLCLDNFFTGSKANIAHLKTHPYFEIIRHNICEPIALEVDEIYNLACPASPVHYQLFPVETIRTNVLGAANVLELAKKSRIKIFQASTSEVYGDPLEHPQKESYWGNVNPIGCRSCYDEGKRCAETLFFDYYRQYQIPIKVGRIFNTYGPRMDINDGRVISNFIVQALKNQDITIYGDGTQTRSFCFASDLIDAIIAFMETDNSVIGPINLGNPIEFTMLQLAEAIIKLTNSSSKMIFAPLPQDDPKKRKPDIAKATQLINWTPKTPLYEGLKKTIAYFNKLIDGCSMNNLILANEHS